MLRFAMGVMRKDKIRNKYIKGTVKVEQLGMKGGQAEVVWTCHEEKPGVHRKRGDGRSYQERGKEGNQKRKFPDVLKEDMGKVGAGKRTLKTRCFGDT